jgi:hypothetical protein
MRLYPGQGEVGAVLRQYRQFENYFRQELELVPSSANSIACSIVIARPPSASAANFASPGSSQHCCEPLQLGSIKIP